MTQIVLASNATATATPAHGHHPHHHHHSNYPVDTMVPPTVPTAGLSRRPDDPSSTWGSPANVYSSGTVYRPQTEFHTYQGYGYPTPISLAYTSAIPMPYPVQQPARFGYCPEQMSPPQHRSYHHPASPDSESASSSSKSPQTPSATATAPTPTLNNTTTNTNNNTNTTTTTTTANTTTTDSTTNVQTTQPLVTPLVPSSPPKFSNPTTDRVKETIARANSVPMEFYHTEFLEYSKETYEKKVGARNKRKRQQQQQQQQHNEDGGMIKKQKRNDDAEQVGNTEDVTSAVKVSPTATATTTFGDENVKDEEEQDFLKIVDDETDPDQLTNTELRRQIHIQSEQKRRAQIKDGFDELRKHLPGCNNKKMSKAALLNRTVQQMQHLKSMQVELLEEVERLMQENENLKKFQHEVFQRQAMEKMYTF